MSQMRTMTEPDIGRFINRVIKRGLFLTLAVAVLFLIMGRDTWAKGVVLGGLASAANFYLMAALLPRIFGPRGRAERLSLFSWLIRFVVMGAALALAHYFPGMFSFLACAAGLFAVQAVLVLEQLWASRKG
jgi:hypothetical protein